MLKFAGSGISLISRGTRFLGSLFCEGSLRVEGVLEGEINSQGEVVIGRSGRVEGRIAAKSLVVAGLLQGNADIQGRLEITAKGQINGDVQTGQLYVEPGGILLGNCKMQNANGEKEKQVAAAAEDER